MKQIKSINELNIGSIIYVPDHINVNGLEIKMFNAYLKIIEINKVMIKNYLTYIYRYNIYEKESLKYILVEGFQQAIIEMRIYKGD